MPIYLDHAATTPTDARVVEAMLPYLTERFGNPSSIHASGRRARQALDEARETVARILGAEPREVVFTSGGSEADNLAIKGAAWAASARGRHIVTSAVEHKAVLHTCQVLERQGFEVTYVGVDRLGRVDPEDIRAAITERTTLVSIVYGQNEVGTLQPIAEIGGICRERGVLFHTDAVQAAVSQPLDVDRLGVDLLSLSGHKLYGPKGIGALFVRRGTSLLPQLQGGAQERQRRAGTENVAGAVAFAVALGLVHDDVATRDRQNGREADLRNGLVDRLLSLPGVALSGDPDRRLPNNASFLVDGVDGADLVAALDLAGVETSTGSACASGSTDPSHVLLAMGVAPDRARGALRLTIGRDTTAGEVEAAGEIIVDCLARLMGRRMPLQATASA